MHFSTSTFYPKNYEANHNNDKRLDGKRRKAEKQNVGNCYHGGPTAQVFTCICPEVFIMKSDLFKNLCESKHFIFIETYIYNGMLVSGVLQSDSAFSSVA